MIATTVKRTLEEFIDDDCPAMAAALAYYTVFSLPPLLVLIVSTVGSIFGRAAVQGRISDQIRGLMGVRAAHQAETMIADLTLSGSGGLATILGVAALIFAATTAFAQLQSSLNRAWEVKPDPSASTIKNFLFKRVLSFGMILAVGFLLVVSLAFSAALTAFGDMVQRYLPANFSGGFLRGASLVLNFCVFSALFGALYKVLPDAEVHWRDVGMGATITALLFGIGKYGVSLYLGSTNVLSPYGAAGSLALILLWTYYSAMIFLIGAEFTQVWARAHGRGMVPEPGAVRVKREEKQLPR